MTAPDLSGATLDSRPTRIRYVVVAVSTLMAVLLYLDRICVGFAVDYIREDIRLTQDDISWFISAFFWSYALAQVPSGWLSDRFGPRAMLVVYILSWSFFTGMIGAVNSFALLIVTRLGIGLAQAGAYPSCGTLLKRWVPVSARATASSVVAFGGRIGGALAPALTAWLIVLCVPSDVPVRLTTADLLNAADVYKKLDAAGRAEGAATVSPQHRVWELLSAADQDEVGQVVPSLANGPTPEQQERLVGMLNGLMERSDLYRREDFASVSLNGEIERFLKREARGEKPTEAEQLRVNRLLLETAFPTGIKKLYVHGWRPVMYFYGLAGILVAGVFWFYFRDTPAQHPGVNEAERRLIASSDIAGAESAPQVTASEGACVMCGGLVPAGVARCPRCGEAATGRAAEPEPSTEREPLPIVPILTDFSLWCSCVSQIGTNIGWIFLISWLSRFLLEVHQVPALTRGLMVSVPLWFGMAGLLIGGPLTDRLTRRYGLRWGRRLPMVATRFIAAAGYGIALLLSMLPTDSPLNSPWIFVLAMSLVALGTDMGIAAVWAYVQDVGGKNVGSVLGWGNMWGNLGAAIAPRIYNWILGETPTLSQWNWMFAACALAFIISGIAGFGVDATRVVGARQPRPAGPSEQ